MSKKQVLVTLDSLKYPNTGLYHFALSLGNALLAQNAEKLELCYYLKKRSAALFEGKARLIYLVKLHKLFFPYANRFNLVHFTDQYCRLNPKLVKGTKILTIHDMNPVHEAGAIEGNLAIYLKKLGSNINACNRIVAISNFVARDVINYFPQAADKISVIYNGADELTVTPGHQPLYIPKKPFLFTIGMLSPKKNFHVLPALLQGNEFELVISGICTTYKDKILEEADKFNCRGRVTITGAIPNADKAWYYRYCVAFVFPSLAEGFGLPVIEAMHFGKPVFLSKYTSLPEIAQNNAYYFDNFKPDSMRETLMKGLEHFNQYNMSDAIKLYAAKFSWDKTARDYLNLYNECLS